MKSIKLLAGMLATMTVAFGIASCGGGQAGDGPAAAEFTVQLDRDSSIAADEVQLGLVPVDGRAGEYSFDVVASGLDGTKAIYGVLEYDRSSYSFSSANIAGSGDDRLFLAKPMDDGVNFGMVLANFDIREGLSGSQSIARISFSRGAEQAGRVISRAPAGAVNNFEIEGMLNENTGQPELSWPEINSGDGDNNGLVTLSDLTPLGISLNSGQVTPGSQQDKADYNRDSLVTINDITPLGINLGTSLGGYVILSGATEGGLTELERVNRADEFGSPKAPDGILQWEWTGAELQDDTFFAVQYFDAEGAVGSRSTNTVFIEAATQAPLLSNVTVSLPSGLTLDEEGGRFVVLLTEASVDSTAGNSEDFAIEMIGLTATAESEADPGNEFDATEQLIWTVPQGGNSAVVSDSAGSKGQLSFRNRGVVTVRAHAPGNNLQFDEISFVLLSIDSLAISLGGGGTGPVGITVGEPVGFVAEGTFQHEVMDTGGNVTETITRMMTITPWVAWAVIPDGDNAGTASFETGQAVLHSDDLQVGDEVTVVAEFSPGDSVTLYDHAKRVSNQVEVVVN